MLHRVYALNIMKAVLIGLIPLDHPQTPFFQYNIIVIKSSLFSIIILLRNSLFNIIII